MSFQEPSLRWRSNQATPLTQTGGHPPPFDRGGAQDVTPVPSADLRQSRTLPADDEEMATSSAARQGPHRAPSTARRVRRLLQPSATASGDRKHPTRPTVGSAATSDQPWHRTSRPHASSNSDRGPQRRGRCRPLQRCDRQRAPRPSSACPLRRHTRRGLHRPPTRAAFSNSTRHGATSPQDSHTDATPTTSLHCQGCPATHLSDMSRDTTFASRWRANKRRLGPQRPGSGWVSRRRRRTARRG